MNFGLYIHIPFCKSRCIYCGFYSSTLSNLKERYVDALCREIELRKDYLPGNLTTIYIGGGTPSQLSPALLQRIFAYINKVWGVPVGEITMECNPDDVTEEFAGALRSLPVNRVSMGVQTFSPERLRFLHRRHTARQIPLAVDCLRHAGIKNISIDLMFGFPGETLADWEQDLRHAIALNVEHISAYSLMYEEGTPLYGMLQRGEVEEISDERSLEMYNRLIDFLTATGYEHYEISNFARHGYRSRHNSSYWHAVPYIGIGAAAHSYNLKSRQWNVSNIEQYIQSIEQGTVPMERETLDADTRYDDLITTALRTAEGIDINKVEEPYKSYLLRMSKPYIHVGEMAIENDRLHLTRKGLFISDSIMADLIFDL